MCAQLDALSINDITGKSIAALRLPCRHPISFTLGRNVLRNFSMDFDRKGAFLEFSTLTSSSRGKVPFVQNSGGRGIIFRVSEKVDICNDRLSQAMKEPDRFDLVLTFAVLEHVVI
jgi:hypothetical protein